MDTHSLHHSEHEHLVAERAALLTRSQQPMPHPTKQERLVRVLQHFGEVMDASPLHGLSETLRRFHSSRMGLGISIDRPVVVSVQNPRPSPDYYLDLFDPVHVLSERNIAHFDGEGWIAVTFRAEAGSRVLLDIALGAQPGALFHCGFGTQDVHPYVGWGTGTPTNDIAVGAARRLYVATEIPAGVDGHAAMILWPRQVVAWDFFDCTVTVY